ncbi:phosphotransferase family protein [Microbacterium trichothecenolyticum]|uniref:Phosphotransferase family protein n=1 Tax=Microbacterium ureisolvens TaxID=2781186 RepID=A0ABS7I358_9MICO|nr:MULTISPECIES: choline/ethanolamine kinase family protein [Microbacterium]MBW9111983.1 phosphotransferase family protein [Microbacterium ureisolvens]MBW9122408.1 phosphotransferase family protein [Microbacterium trichothecenolyticum]
MTDVDAATPSAVHTDLRRRLGDGRTISEQRAEDCLRRVTQWAGREVFYTPVSGGLQNSNWRVDVTGDPVAYFLKVPGEGTEDFIDRGNSHLAAVRAGELGISPRIVHFDAENGVEVIEFLEGYRACTNGDMKRWEVTESVLALQNAFHTIAPLPVTKTIFELIDEHLTQVKEIGVRLPSFAEPLLREYEAARAAYTASGLDIVPCHNDPMPGNFLVSPGKPMRMVDFEFASNNERAYDLAVTFTEYFYDEPAILRCIDAVYGTTSWDIVSRVQVASALADIKWGLWGCVNHQLNASWDYDFHKYGVWKLLRARTKVADPRWGQWLHAI